MTCSRRALLLALIACASAQCTWSYAGADGPAAWPTLCSGNWAACGGTSQSPINIDTASAAVDAALGNLNFQFASGSANASASNNGHFFELSGFSAASTLSGGPLSGTFTLQRIEFHNPAEHQLDSSVALVEAVLVYTATSNTTTQTVAVSLLFTAGGASSALAPLVSALPQLVASNSSASVSITPVLFTPTSQNYYIYDGSNSYPSCESGWTRIVMQGTFAINSTQLDALRSIHNMTARPVQALGARAVRQWTGFQPNLELLTLPGFYSISLFANNVPGARSLALGEEGIVFVGTCDQGVVYAVVPSNDTFAGYTMTVLRGLDCPNGVAFYNGTLYVAQRTSIVAYANIMQSLDAPPAPVTLQTLPVQLEHNWRYISIGPDSRLYVSIGADCNACIPQPEAGLWAMRLDGSEFVSVARGVRNSLGFDWRPTDSTMWFTDNGRDGWGPSLPPDELNAIFNNTVNMSYGFPYCYGDDDADLDFNPSGKCDAYLPPDYELPAHSVPLGMRFYTGKRFSAEMNEDTIIIAEHGANFETYTTQTGSNSGSTTQSVAGYALSRVNARLESPTSYSVFVSGWLGTVDSPDEAWGRPVDVINYPDGSILVSDDRANVIYQISYDLKRSELSLLQSVLVVLGFIAIAGAVIFALTRYYRARARSAASYAPVHNNEESGLLG